MKQFRVYIAFLLLSVFIYPVLFQSVHSIHKHRHEINSCCNTHNNNIRVNSTETISIPDNEFHCPVCEYKFSVNNVTPNVIKAICYTVVSFRYIAYTPNVYIALLSGTKSPRAPPLL